uniref:Transmembrane protein 255A n=1 Tax=Apteryx owenii TaxID=8824 RepID=A0A8B9PKX1_APTOW
FSTPCALILSKFCCVCVFLGSFNRRKRNSLYVTVTLLIVSVLILTVGLAATTRTQNVTVGGYYPGVIVSIELLGRSRKLIAYKVPCNAANVIKGDRVLNINICSATSLPFDLFDLLLFCTCCSFPCFTVEKHVQLYPLLLSDRHLGGSAPPADNSDTSDADNEGPFVPSVEKHVFFPFDAG